MCFVVNPSLNDWNLDPRHYLGLAEDFMISITMLTLVALIVTARFCPDTPLGRLILDLLVDSPANWLSKPNWKKALPYALVALGAVLVMLSAPELAPLAAGLDLSFMADLLLIGMLATTQLNLRRLRRIGRFIRHGMIRHIRRTTRARRQRSIRRPHPPRGDEEAPGDTWAFA
jgi:hypothetical protein